MAADVIEAAQFALRAAHQQQRFAQKFDGKEVAGVGELAAMPDHLPGVGEDSFLFLCEHPGVSVERSRNRPGAGGPVVCSWQMASYSKGFSS